MHHKQTVRNSRQPLLRISSADRELCMLAPGGEPAADGKKRSYRSYKVGELMGVEAVTAGLWRQAQMLPWILHRVFSLVSALNFVDNSWTERQLTFAGVHALTEDIRRPKAEMEAKFMFLIGGSRIPAAASTPSPGQIVQALTLASAMDNWNMERLEILGDAFLKYATTIFLYYKMADSCDEGDLSSARSRIVGNKNLMLIARNQGLANCGILADRMDPARTWTPPGFRIPALDQFDSVEDKLVSLDNEQTWEIGQLCKYLKAEDVAKLRTGELTEEALVDLARTRRSNKEQVGGGVRLRSYRIMSDKSLADCVEALLGTFLYNCGMDNCLQFMARLGINFDTSMEVTDVYKRVRNLLDRKMEHFKPQTDAFVNDTARNETARYHKLLERLGVGDIERIVGYTFKEKSFLLSAFTHPSYEDNRLTASYEKLELLGDAVLDYLVSCHIYTHTAADPGRLTDIRAALVCNNEFASVLTDHGLDKFILHCNPGILSRVSAYLATKDSLGNKGQKIEDTVMQYNEEDVPELEMIEVPKVLGDVLESLIGAIFIDSGHDLETVWRIYRRLCPDLEAIVADPPMNMKKELLERYPGGAAKFSKSIVCGDVVFIEVEVNVGGQPPAAPQKRRFRGRGKNKTLATLAACKCALRALKKP